MHSSWYTTNSGSVIKAVLEQQWYVRCQHSSLTWNVWKFYFCLYTAWLATPQALKYRKKYEETQPTSVYEKKTSGRNNVRLCLHRPARLAVNFVSNYRSNRKGWKRKNVPEISALGNFYSLIKYIHLTKPQWLMLLKCSFRLFKANTTLSLSHVEQKKGISREIINLTKTFKIAESFFS